MLKISGETLSVVRHFTSSAEKCVAESISEIEKRVLQIKPKNFRFSELNALSKDVFESRIGQPNLPRYLIHLTSKKNYESMLENGVLRTGGRGDKIPGVYTLELGNFFRWWNKTKSWNGEKISIELLDQVKKGSDEIVALRIPTKELDTDALRIRSQSRYFGRKKSIDPDENLRHISYGDSATNWKRYKDRKEAIEFIYQGDIPITKTQKIGEAVVDTTKPISLKEIFSNLFKGKPEEQALVLLNE